MNKHQAVTYTLANPIDDSANPMLNQKRLSCPVCNSNAKLTGFLKADYIINQIELYYCEKLPSNLGIIDYKMYRCEKCTLEWADPPVGGADSFYKWIIDHPAYYPNERWEWTAVIERMRKTPCSGIADVLEIGCGHGEFLEALQDVPNIRAVGLDTAMDSVTNCRAKDLEVYCETIDSFLESANKRHGFDWIVAFHCLEHVCYPQNFLAAMVSLLKPSGVIFLSTPYSPMSFESRWFDPLNHPPHHMTRWNARSYNELARQIGMQIELFMPNSNNSTFQIIEELIPLNRTLNSLNLAWHGPVQLLSKRKMIFAALRHPLIFCEELFFQKKREKINNMTTADVVLVELTPDLSTY